VLSFSAANDQCTEHCIYTGAFRAPRGALWPPVFSALEKHLLTYLYLACMPRPLNSPWRHLESLNFIHIRRIVTSTVRRFSAWVKIVLYGSTFVMHLVFLRAVCMVCLNALGLMMMTMTTFIGPLLQWSVGGIKHWRWRQKYDRRGTVELNASTHKPDVYTWHISAYPLSLVTRS